MLAIERFVVHIRIVSTERTSETGFTEDSQRLTYGMTIKTTAAVAAPADQPIGVTTVGHQLRGRSIVDSLSSDWGDCKVLKW